ncbi:MAG TPA: ABC transporter permease [Thermoanaerobaculia bacterium]|nr:ABC transporter permease [Thermoanaerobaculia bacterium]
MLARVLAGSARHRPGYLLTVLVATAAATTALAAAAGLGARLHAIVTAGHALGVNVLVRPQPGGPATLPLREIARLRALAGVEAVAPWAELGERDGRPLLATRREAIALHRGWMVEGAWPAAGEVLAGAATGFAAEGTALPRARGDGDPRGVARGASVDTPIGVRLVSGILRTGEALDGALIADLDSLPATAAIGVQRFELRADPRRVEAVAAAVMRTVPGAEAQPLLRVTTTRARLVRRLLWILAGAGVLTALLALGTLAAASFAQLHARRRELALFFALGYTRAWVSRLLGFELLIVGAAAWLLGSAAGELLAGLFARRLFDGDGALFAGGAWGAGAALAGGAAVLAVTGRLTARRLAGLEPAALLAGR